MDSWDASAFCDRVNAPSKWRHVITGTADVLSKIPELSKLNLKHSEIDQLLKAIDETAINALSLLQRERPAGLRLKLYTESLRNIRPSLDGRDLINLGSRVPVDRKRLLDDLRGAILDVKRKFVGFVNNYRNDESVDILPPRANNSRTRRLRAVEETLG